MHSSSSRAVLVAECRELLVSFEATLAATDPQFAAGEQVDELFRVVHTIKGSAGLLGMQLVVGFTHVMENVLDRLRNGQLSLDDALIQLLLRCADYVWSLVDAVEQGQECSDPQPALRSELLAALESVFSSVETRSGAPAEGMVARLTSPTYFHVSLSFHPLELQTGVDPIALIEYLADLGELTYLYTLSERLPRLSQLTPDECHLRFELGLQTVKGRAAVENCLSFVRDESRIQIFSSDEADAAARRLLAESGEYQGSLQKVMEALGYLGTSAIVKADQSALQTSDAGQKTKTPAESPGHTKTLKVDAGQLDELILAVSEMVMTSEAAQVMFARGDTPTLGELLDKNSQLLGEVRDRALTLRMVPFGEVFERFPRVIREVARELGKQVTTEISGADTKIDKSLAEKLADPLLHIIRNAMDHGLEAAEERQRSGKKPAGNIGLHARYEAASVVIEIRDDGRGLSCERIFAKAVEQGLVSADAQLSTSEIQQLIFAPGFSTAEQVTTLSGRGVGMDVVKRVVTQLRGQIEIESEPMRGTTFRIRVPLTLALIDGFQVLVGETMFIIPLHMVKECMDARSFGADQGLLNLRGTPLPYLRLREILDSTGPLPSRESLVVIEHERQRLGLVVDRLCGDVQAVIKPLGPLFQGVHHVSNATVLGDGSIALILDIPTIFTEALRIHKSASVAVHAAE